MTTNSFLRVMATALVLVAACKSEFPAGSYDGGTKDAPAQEAANFQEGGSPNAQEGGPPTSSSLVSCDPCQPAPIMLATVLGAGQDTDGTLYVVDRLQEAGSERVFVSSGGTLQRQPIAGSGGAGDGSGVTTYGFSISDHVPPFTLELETNAAGPVAMGVLQGTLTRSFTIGQQGTVLTLVPASQVVALPAADIPAFLDYNATLSDGRALLVVSPVLGDGAHDYFRVFFGTTSRMIERSIVEVNEDSSYSTTIRFSVEGMVAVASFPVVSPGVPGPATLTIGNTQFPLTLGPTDSPPTGYTYACPGDSSTDAGVDAWSALPVDGPPTCRPPSPDYGPTSVFPVLPYGTPATPTTCSAACGTSAWPLYGNTIDIALPYGACAPGTPSCSALATVPCACANAGRVDGFNCSCEGGTWICRILSLAGVICTPCPDAGAGNPDGGNDASPVLQGIFASTGSMSVARFLHSATLLPNGKVLIAGGSRVGGFGAFANAELYDPSAGTFTATGSMSVARYGHTATLLPNGKALIAGGNETDMTPEPLLNAELYDPAAGTFAATGSMILGRYYPTATLLANGKVLIAGGAGTGAELYDPAVGTFTATGSMTVARTEQTATLLTSGKVLIAGGFDYVSLATAELYDPDTGTFTATGSMTAARYFHTATSLPDGKVLIAGGYDVGYLESAELYDPLAGTFTATGNMTASRVSHTATLLGSGKVLIASGDASDRASAELYDPRAGTFAATGDMTAPRVSPTAALLSTGKVLIAGGMSFRSDNSTVDLASAELYE